MSATIQDQLRALLQSHFNETGEAIQNIDVYWDEPPNDLRGMRLSGIHLETSRWFNNEAKMP